MSNCNSGDIFGRVVMRGCLCFSVCIFVLFNRAFFYNAFTVFCVSEYFFMGIIVEGF